MECGGQESSSSSSEEEKVEEEEKEEEEEKYEPDLDLEADFPQGKRRLHPPAVCDVNGQSGKFCELPLRPAFLL